MSKLHLDYSEYKALVADNGITECVKYNWLSGPEGSDFGGFMRKKIKDCTITFTVSEGRSLFTFSSNDIKDALIPTSGEKSNVYLAGYNQREAGKTTRNKDIGYSDANKLVFCNNDYYSLEEMLAVEGNKYFIYELAPVNEGGN